MSLQYDQKVTKTQKDVTVDPYFWSAIDYHPVIKPPLKGVAHCPSPMQSAQPRAQNIRPPAQQADMFFIRR